MYKLNERITIEIKFIKREEYGQKVYEDKSGNTIIWYTNSNNLEHKNWFKVSTKLYNSLDKNKNIRHYILHNPREIKI